MSMEDINAARRRSTKALVERMLGGELSRHLGYQPGNDKPANARIIANATSPKAS